MVQIEELIKSIILGIVEGVTEFLPISSTGHLIAASALLNFQGATGGTFEIFIQLGAVIAVVLYYRARLFGQARRVITDRGIQHFWLALVLATLPAAVIGFITRDFIKDVLFSPNVVAVSLIVGGIVLIVIETRRTTPAPIDEPADAVEKITYGQAFFVGCVQVIALIPGVSRSAASIIGGMFTGLSRRTATEFSFFLAIPTLGGATMADFIFSLDEITADQLIYYFTGLVVAGLVAWGSIAWLLRYVQRHSFTAFGVYRIIAGGVLLVLSVTKIL
ncbi:MAG: undecaprenyl-diphosphate phosphatase [bacterium]|nr:undecaprenyl-diphosphate phosphatase [bacterium]